MTAQKFLETHQKRNLVPFLGSLRLNYDNLLQSFFSVKESFDTNSSVNNL